MELRSTFVVLALASVAFVAILLAAPLAPRTAEQPSARPTTERPTDQQTAGEPSVPEWAPLTLMEVVEPEAWGAVGDGSADDGPALLETIEALPAGGGIVWLGTGRVHRTTDVLRITRDHVKLWAPDGQAKILASGGEGLRQAVIVDGARGVGLFGLALGSNADRRRTALEDSAVVLDGAVESELVGMEITGSSSAAIFVFGGSRRTWIEGNDLRDNWADGIHFTDGSREAWVWHNVIVNEAPIPGDDGIACVTYGSGPRCGSMEWWSNTHEGNGWGRGLAVVGGDGIDIHDNHVRDTAGAGILVASEPSYDSPGSDDVRIDGNLVERAGHTVAHPGILVSALNGPITGVVISDNTVIDTHAQSAVRAEGDVVDLVEEGTSTDRSSSRPPAAGTPDGSPGARSTSILATRDVSFVPDGRRRGLYRIHVRGDPDSGFEQRLEYVVAGSPADVDGWLAHWKGTWARFRSPAGGVDRLVIRTGSPLELPPALRPVDFEELRASSDQVPELFDHLDAL